MYRSRDAYVGGVCAGVAERLDFDPIVVRVFTVFVTVLTLGLGAVVYLVMWARLPRATQDKSLYEVTPESAESTSYGSLNCLTGCADKDGLDSRVDTMALLARLAVAVALVLLFLVLAFNVAPLVPGTEWWQFWPLAPFTIGLCLIIVPLPFSSQAVWHALGIIIASLSATVLPMSLGIVSWSSLSFAFSQAWFLVAAAAVVFAVGVYRGINALVVAASFIFLIFCVVTLTACAIPGDLEMLMVHMPDGHSVRLFMVEG